MHFRLPVLWVCGAAGAGKSTSAWALFRELADSGLTAGYVDIDQLGMLYPAAESDPHRHLVKAHALAELVPGYTAAGARALVVSGVVDPDAGPDPAAMAAVDLTLCLLTPAPGALGSRLSARGWAEGAVRQAVAEDAALRRAGFVDAVIQTAGLTESQVAQRLRTQLIVAGRARVSAPPTDVGGTSAAKTPVVLLTGARVVGLSTLGFGLATTRWRAGRSTGFVDLQQLAFMSGPAPRDRARSVLQVTQFAAIHEHLAAQGARMVIANGHLHSDEREALAAKVPNASVISVHVRADVPSLRAHMMERVAGHAARLAGDDLLGATVEHQQAVVTAAVADQERRDQDTLGGAVIDVSGESPVASVEQIDRLLSARWAQLSQRHRTVGRRRSHL